LSDGYEPAKHRRERLVLNCLLRERCIDGITTRQALLILLEKKLQLEERRLSGLR